ncbi:5-formyltetrahydrofolate cyclo-ligase [Shewanella fidelis]|uniref:5-formyltetrahydrofolate cyclo-ligase n=1 Tax=Shewanella fidelis TaxID=173509 RepID=A0AAW8NH09_9GAMM|nr:5-formyltetrahydrofolate cyclo-ligase [Shewanella fidelis]MDR8522638.1 5-formyltetrahydrofolate cyclo-ligase [Shewanella fidelis]MDW4812254.1 5-formyltetrahydrofolate cyclo-ligase [Shewanella fidelis]MDW4816082.1 5-formyltetrahydrofolate cyclo-ligase [Shewanella fidelis]MDW4820495.1 5-formyltetrahydrofolate cyclo-ligase [Shewanella fidelis]MDW4824717.1 5-formyltetrahydrofolate cyclo-ligase [Shewanella fidelis]
MPQQPPPLYSTATLIQSCRKELRQQIRQARRSLKEEQQTHYAQTAAKLAVAHLCQLKARRVAVYLTNDGELDTKPLIEALWQAGIEVYLPRLHPFSVGNLIFLRYDKNTQLQQNSLNIWEPKLDITQMILAHELDVVITPLVAFDKQGNRMGMGGGYYDRTLANWQTVGRPMPIGYAHDCQQVDSLPCEHWDVPLPVIVSPSAIYEYHARD